MKGADDVRSENGLTLSSARREAPVGDHSQVQPLLEPNPVHHPDDLEYQHVLRQVISCLINTPSRTVKTDPTAVCTAETHSSGRYELVR